MKYLKLMRIKHYLKNGLIFFPLIFSGMLFNKSLLYMSFIGFISFSFIASIIYIVNDIRDIDKDRNHPVKKKRPLASGEVKIFEAKILVLLLAIIVLLLLSFNKIIFTWSSLILLLYFVLNLGYSFGLKNVPLIDVAILAFGFVLRVIYGGLLLNIEISNWLFLTILSASFYMALGKRNNELKKLKNSETRNVLKYYPKEFLDKNMYVFLSLTIVFYSLWATMGVNNQWFRYSVVFVILIFMKYSMNIEGDSLGDPIEVLLHDKVLIALAFIYCLFCFAILYLV